jgi:hypothetical protein
MVDQLVLISLNQLIFILKIFIFITKSFLHEEVNCTEPSPSVSASWLRCLILEQGTKQLTVMSRNWIIASSRG